MIEKIKKIYNNCFNTYQLRFLEENPEKYEDMYFAIKKALESLILL